MANPYPLALSLAVGTAPDQVNLASARCSLASDIAILLAPLVLASLADRVGIRNADGVVAVLLVLALLISLGAHRIAPRGMPLPVAA